MRPGAWLWPWLVLAGAAPALADVVPKAAIDRLVTAEMARQRIPGLALAVLRHGQPVYVRGYGVASLEWPREVRPDTRFQIGSIGKQFTAVAVMMLVRDGRLELDAPLARYLPEVPAAWSAVTLRRMLAHQSGIAQLDGEGRHLLDLRHEYSDEEYLRLAISQPLEFEPGTDAAYSDTAYVLLGVVINRVTGRFYGDLLAERVFAPLAMERTRVISDEDIVPGRASGYELDEGGALRNQSFVSAALNRTADGSLYSTVLDLARWDAALREGTLLPTAAMQAALVPVQLADGGQTHWPPDGDEDDLAPGQPVSYGYGWFLDPLDGHRRMWHFGTTRGFRSAIMRLPDENMTAIVLCNRSDLDARMIAERLLRDALATRP